MFHAVSGISFSSRSLRMNSTFAHSGLSFRREHESVPKAAVGQSVGVKVQEHAREHDEVYKVVPDA